MGVKGLNRILKAECKNGGIQDMSIDNLSGKTLAVDASIYMYLFVRDKEDGADSFETMCKGFKNLIERFKVLQTRLMFVMDSSTPAIKKVAVTRRSDVKMQALNREKLKALEERGGVSDSHLKNMKSRLTRVKISERIEIENWLRENHQCVVKVKGMEADPICAYLTIAGFADGCLSDDIDLVVYGCTYLYKDLDIERGVVVEYCTSDILLNLHMDHVALKKVASLAETDYGDLKGSTSIEASFKLFKQFSKLKDEELRADFMAFAMKKGWKVNVALDVCKAFDLETYMDKLKEVRIEFEEEKTEIGIRATEISETTAEPEITFCDD